MRYVNMQYFVGVLLFVAHAATYLILYIGIDNIICRIVCGIISISSIIGFYMIFKKNYRTKYMLSICVRTIKYYSYICILQLAKKVFRTKIQFYAYVSLVFFIIVDLGKLFFYEKIKTNYYNTILDEFRYSVLVFDRVVLYLRHLISEENIIVPTERMLSEFTRNPEIKLEENDRIFDILCGEQLNSGNKNFVVDFGKHANNKNYESETQKRVKKSNNLEIEKSVDLSFSTQNYIKIKTDLEFESSTIENEIDNSDDISNNENLNDYETDTFATDSQCRNIEEESRIDELGVYDCDNESQLNGNVFKDVDNIDKLGISPSNNAFVASHNSPSVGVEAFPCDSVLNNKELNSINLETEKYTTKNQNSQKLNGDNACLDIRSSISNEMNISTTIDQNKNKIASEKVSLNKNDATFDTHNEAFTISKDEIKDILINCQPKNDNKVILGENKKDNVNVSTQSQNFEETNNLQHCLDSNYIENSNLLKDQVTNDVEYGGKKNVSHNSNFITKNRDVEEEISANLAISNDDLFRFAQFNSDSEKHELYNDFTRKQCVRINENKEKVTKTITEETLSVNFQNKTIKQIITALTFFSKTEVNNTNWNDVSRQIFKEKSNVYKSLYNYDKLFKMLYFMLNLAVLAIVMVFFMVLHQYKISSAPYIISIISYMFLPSLRKVAEAFFFIIINHPFDCGDRVVINGDVMIVKKINLFSTIFDKWNGELIIFNNLQLSKLCLDNYNRSGNQRNEYELLINRSDIDKMLNVELDMDIFVTNDARYSECNFCVQSIDHGMFLIYKIFLTQTSNFRNGYYMWRAKTDFVENIKNSMKKYGIKYIPLERNILLMEY
ncbi:hypothetical protein EDEG_00541 [Edhazardia aedis USNM 41457]|uniref:Mechanosensitive ion channel MscS domain-containing protein n=1 Tax=Edhazardia aedis (strain USNM 41457) TaxID=1003232 RepID=J9D046_EDHAE|nr:hypothetical protein EDEG_00541 [Edhazardia aedis USNM 41457]|eukprot:EJW01241.1 hypothetical protein EDEG_00541 [Edhazardia aedis USNM 41457]